MNQASGECTQLSLVIRCVGAVYAQRTNLTPGGVGDLCKATFTVCTN